MTNPHSTRDEYSLQYARNQVEITEKRDKNDSERDAILFDNYLILGEFEKAYTVSQGNKERSERLALITGAIQKDDGANCSCGQNTNVQVGRVYSATKHREWFDNQMRRLRRL